MSDPLRLLLIDDNPDDRMLVIRELQQEFSGLRVEQIADSENFALGLESGDFDLVITDYQLRWTDGLEILSAVKARKPDIPIIMFTATGSEEIAVEAMKNGLDDYVLKSPKHFVRLRGVVRSALEKAEQRRLLNKTRERFHHVLATSPAVIYSCKIVVISENEVSYPATFISESVTKMFGYKVEECLENPNWWQERIHPDDVNLVFAQAPRLFEEGYIVCEYRFRLKDGNYRWVRDEMVVVCNDAGEPVELVCSLIDIDKNKLAEEAVRESEERYRIVGETATDGIITIDEESIILFANPAAEKIFGYSVNEMLGRQLTMLMPDYLRRVHMESLNRYIKTGERHIDWESVELSGLHKTGREMPLEVSLGEYNKGGRHLFTGILRDITERKKLEEQLRQSQKMEAVGKLAGGVAHDFNNLLTAIIGYGQLACNVLNPDDPIRHNVEEMVKAGERAALLTNQLLAFSRKQMLQPKELDLSGVVADMEKMLTRIIGEDVNLITKFEPEKSFVLADPGQIGQVIINLAVNAREAMPEGGNLIIETEKIHLDEQYARRHIGFAPGQYVALTVSDTGRGMDAQTRSQIFEPFFTTKEKGKGTGLGLSTVYGIVQQSGGHILVESEPGHGASFKIFLPCTEEVTADRTAVIPFSEMARGTETILLVEDEDAVRNLVSEILLESGYQVIPAGNGQEAIRLCEQYQGEIHLMLTDVVMPQMSGREIAERLSASRPDMKTLYMSGYTDDAIVHHGVLDEGVNFLHKPFTPGSLTRKLRQVLDQ